MPITDEIIHNSSIPRTWKEMTEPHVVYKMCDDGPFDRLFCPCGGDKEFALLQHSYCTVAQCLKCNRYWEIHSG